MKTEWPMNPNLRRLRYLVPRVHGRDDQQGNLVLALGHCQGEKQEGIVRGSGSRYDTS